jgi:carbonic anhydrase/acetyltransferase-like protein (isoleucine patch superfamily)
LSGPDFRYRSACAANRARPSGREDSDMSIRIADSADVDDRAQIGADTSIWHLAQVREDAVVGRECTIGRGAYVGPGVRLGERVKLQNYALVYEPAVLGDGVFVGPAAVLTNDEYPRSVTPQGRRKTGEDWHAVGVEVAERARSASRRCASGVGRWSPPVPWWSRTYPTSRSWWACRPAGSTGSGGPGFR